MGQLKFKITFRGGKANKHWVPLETLASIFQAISSDIENVYRVISANDRDITSNEIKHNSRLYLSAQPKAGSQELSFVSEPTDSDYIEAAGKTWIRGLSIIGSNITVDEKLPVGITSSVLKNAKLYSMPSNEDYEAMELSIDDSETSIVFDTKLGVAIERQLIELSVKPVEIQGYEVEGILHALDDQDYENPSANVMLKIDSSEGDWFCSISREILPDDVNELWKKRVIVLGCALFRPRKRSMTVQKIRILPEKPDLEKAIRHFTKVNSKTFEGQDLIEYLDEIRERN